MNDSFSTVALVLSAGASSRMGQPKALLRFSSGQTLLEDQCSRVATAGINKIFVVVGCDAEKIIDVHKDLDVTWVENKDWEKGKFSSVHCGLVETSGRTSVRNHPFILLFPIDVVGVSVDIIQQIIDEGVASSSNIVPTFEGKGGHPVFLCGETVQTILETPVAKGQLNQILRESKRTQRVEVASKNILNNVNTWEEWEKEMRKI